PAGAAAAIAALDRARTAGRELDVLLLDRADFPRDKPCGDGVAPHVLELLAPFGLDRLLGDRLRRAIPAAVGEAPPGLERALGRMGEVAWAAEDYRVLLRVLAAPRAAKALRHAALIEAGVDIVVIDTAPGHSEGVGKAVSRLKALSNEVQVIAGNVATAEGTRALIDSGA
ncbi:MAG: IMP dehydrogenase, partial [Gemmatimonadota bacterium]